MQAIAPPAFGAAYFRRYYHDPATRVTSPAEMHGRAAMIAAVLRQAQIPVRRMLDAGCGIGLMRAPFAALLPRVRYAGLEVSEYLCRRYGWIPGSVVDFKPRRPYDLVICYDVLQYLGDRDAARALANLPRLTRGAVYVSALTEEDWRRNCDRTRTDGAVHLRAGAWYRRRLERHFRHLGLGVWVRRDVTPMLWEMERAAPARAAIGRAGPRQAAPARAAATGRPVPIGRVPHARARPHQNRRAGD
jgi:SAM-dependent methyltransferase